MHVFYRRSYENIHYFFARRKAKMSILILKTIYEPAAEKRFCHNFQIYLCQNMFWVILYDVIWVSTSSFDSDWICTMCRHQGCVRCEWSNDDHWWCSWAVSEWARVWCAWSGISQLKSERIKSTRYYPQEDGYKSQERKWRDPGHDCWTMVSDVCCSVRTQMSSCITAIKSPTLGGRVSLSFYQKEKVTCVNFSRGHHCHLEHYARAINVRTMNQTQVASATNWSGSLCAILILAAIIRNHAKVIVFETQILNKFIYFYLPICIFKKLH